MFHVKFKYNLSEFALKAILSAGFTKIYMFVELILVKLTFCAFIGSENPIVKLPIASRDNMVAFTYFYI